MVKDNEALNWGKCKVVIDDNIVIAQIQDGTTNLNTEQGEKKEALFEGGEVFRTRFQRNKYTLEFVEYGRATLSNVDGVVAGNHKVKLISCDDGIDKEVFTIPSSVINVQSSFSSEYGTLTTYSCAANRQTTGSAIEWAEGVETPVITITGGKMTITAESGATIYYTTNGSTPTTTTSSTNKTYSTEVTLTESCEIKAIAVVDSVISAVATATYTHASA